MPFRDAKEAVMAINNGQHFEPVPPTGVELAFHYRCPRCRNVMCVASPVRGTRVVCDKCATHFLIAPVDMTLLKFIHVITAGGRAASI